MDGTRLEATDRRRRFRTDPVHVSRPADRSRHIEGPVIRERCRETSSLVCGPYVPMVPSRGRATPWDIPQMLQSSHAIYSSLPKPNHLIWDLVCGEPYAESRGARNRRCELMDT